MMAVDQLMRFPRSGRIVPEVGLPDIRELLVQNYRVVYLLRADDIEILTIRHGARPLGSRDLSPEVDQEPP